MTDRPRSSANPIPVYLWFGFIQSICWGLFFTAHPIYQVVRVGLDPLQLVLVGTAMEAACFLFELPTGIVADLVSRRRSILIGTAITGGAYLLDAGIPAFWSILLAQVVWGLGWTFLSGAHQAWITDEIGEGNVGPVFLRYEQVWLAGGIVGLVGSVLLGLVNIRVPLFAAGFAMLGLTALLWRTMPEMAFTPAPRSDAPFAAHMRRTATQAMAQVRRVPVVRTLVIISLLSGLASEVFDRLSTPLIIDRFDFPALFGRDDPVIWFGMCGLIGTILSLAASELVRRVRPDTFTRDVPARLLAIGAAIDIVAVVGFVLSGNLWLSFAMIWVRGLVATLASPLTAAWLHRHLTSETRATVTSMTGQANAIGQVGGGPALGGLAQRTSIAAAMLTGAAILSPGVWLYARLAERNGRQTR